MQTLTAIINFIMTILDLFHKYFGSSDEKKQ